MTVRQINPDYLRRAAQAPDIAALKKRAYEQLRLKDGGYVVDVGCGPAIDTPALAKIVGTKGWVLGIDGDPAMVAEANRAAVEAGLGTIVKHQVSDAGNLPVERGKVDAVFCERVLQHIPWARCPAVVREMLRALAPGGRLVIVDTDWSTLSIATDDPLLERRVMAEHTLGFANPFSGRNLLALLRGVGGLVNEVTIEPVAIRVNYESARFLLQETLRRAVFSGRLSFAEAQTFIASLVGARDYQLWSAHLTLVLATATKRAT
jgi:SAM-dependent methyltransferase